MCQGPPLQVNRPKLTALSGRIHISYLDCRTFQTSFQLATSTCRGMWAVMAQSGLVLLHSSVCVRRKFLLSPAASSYSSTRRHVPPNHFPLPIASGRLPGGLCRQTVTMATRLADCRERPEEYRSAFVKAAKRVQNTRPVEFLGQPMQWVETPR
jgi:hypothetical protein